MLSSRVRLAETLDTMQFTGSMLYVVRTVSLLTFAPLCAVQGRVLSTRVVL